MKIDSNIDWYDLLIGVAVIIFVYFMFKHDGDTPQMQKVKIEAETQRIKSCNDLKALAIAASAPVPTCAF